MGENDEMSQRMREQGIRLIQSRALEIRSESFTAEAHQQSVAVAAVDRQTDDQAFIEAASADWDARRSSAS